MSGKEEMVCLAVLTSAHGVRGEMKLKSYMEEPSDILGFTTFTSQDGQRRFDLKSIRETGKGFIISLEGVKDRNQTDQLRGTELYVPRSELPEPAEEEWFYSDIAGLNVHDQNDSLIGEVISVQNFGAGDMLEIKFADNQQTEFFPFSKQVVPEIQIADGYLKIIPPEYIIAREQPKNKTDKQNKKS